MRVLDPLPPKAPPQSQTFAPQAPPRGYDIVDTVQIGSKIICVGAELRRVSRNQRKTAKHTLNKGKTLYKQRHKIGNMFAELKIGEEPESPL